MKPVNRRPSGVPTGGQFAATQRAEADIDLGGAPSVETPAADEASQAPAPATNVHAIRDVSTDPGDWDSDDAPSTEMVLAADSDGLWPYVRSQNRFVRAEAAANPSLTDEQLAELQDPDQPYLVRHVAAQVITYGAAERASHDPDPVVRFISRDGFDLSPESRERLAQDQMVSRISELVGSRAS